MSFEINLHVKDILVLHRLKTFFGVGLISTRPNRLNCVYRVTKIEDLVNIIIPHFLAYPLLTKKYSDFYLWSRVVKIMYTKAHLTSSGFNTILRYYSSINLGASKVILASFPGVLTVQREETTIPVNLDPYLVSGFTAGDGVFSIGIRVKTDQIYFRFSVAQHSRDISLINSLISFFGCGKVNIRSNRCDYYVQDISKLTNLIIPHFCLYPLENIKQLDFLDFKKAV